MTIKTRLFVAAIALFLLSLGAARMASAAGAGEPILACWWSVMSIATFIGAVVATIAPIVIWIDSKD